MSSVAELISSRELLGNLVSRELRGKYKRSVLGWSWSLVNPIVTALMFAVVFGVVLGAKAPGAAKVHGHAAFPLYLLVGLLPWALLANGITGSITALTGNANLVRKVYFPREHLVVSSVLSWLVSFGIEMTVLTVALLGFGDFVLPWLPLVALVAAVQVLFVTGMGLALAVLNVYFRDVQHFVALFLQLWFYGTPIIYRLSLVRDKSAAHHIGWVYHLYLLNPMADFIDAYHRMLFQGRGPQWPWLGWATVSALLTLTVGWRLFVRLEPRLAEEL